MFGHIWAKTKTLLQTTCRLTRPSLHHTPYACKLMSIDSMPPQLRPPTPYSKYYSPHCCCKILQPSHPYPLASLFFAPALPSSALPAPASRMGAACCVVLACTFRSPSHSMTLPYAGLRCPDLLYLPLLLAPRSAMPCNDQSSLDSGALLLHPDVRCVLLQYSCHAVCYCVFLRCRHLSNTALPNPMAFTCPICMAYITLASKPLYPCPLLHCPLLNCPALPCSTLLPSAVAWCCMVLPSFCPAQTTALYDPVPNWINSRLNLPTRAH
jgi:hypothetical protein